MAFIEEKFHSCAEIWEGVRVTTESALRRCRQGSAARLSNYSYVYVMSFLSASSRQVSGLRRLSNPPALAVAARVFVFKTAKRAIRLLLRRQIMA